MEGLTISNVVRTRLVLTQQLPNRELDLKEVQGFSEEVRGSDPRQYDPIRIGDVATRTCFLIKTPSFYSLASPPGTQVG
jgi:hypothetical protein